REATGWGDTQLRVHLERLVGLEYLIGQREGAGGKFTYELVFDGDATAAVHLSGLIDVASLRGTPTTQNSRGVELQVAGRLRGDSGPVAVRSRDASLAAKPALTRLPADPSADDTQTPISGSAVPPVMSYPKAVPSLAAAAAA
ncbi:MAG: hypothetical protein WCH44_17645, partial [Betaproteobacteria bacterium]